MISPGTYVGNPWIRFGAAVAVGYKLGCPEQPKRETSRPDQLQSLLRSLLRTVLLNLATSAIHDVMRRPTTES